MSIIFYVYVTNIIQSIHTATKDHNLDKEMRKYGMGLMVNSISWWLNNSLDKYMVLYMCGIAANGLISVAYKFQQFYQRYRIYLSKHGFYLQ